MKIPEAAKKIASVMGEFKDKKLHSGKGGKVVKNPKQAIAIAMSEAKMPMRGQRTAKNKAKK
jgi:Sec-independent protein translocase protein TatA